MHYNLLIALKASKSKVNQLFATEPLLRITSAIVHLLTTVHKPLIFMIIRGVSALAHLLIFFQSTCIFEISEYNESKYLI